MKTTYRVQMFPERIRLVEVVHEPCCEKMKELSADGFVFLDPEWYHGQVPYTQLSFEYSRYGDTEHHQPRLVFCPFCGVKVVTEETERVQMVSRKVTETKAVEHVVWEEVTANLTHPEG